MNLEEYFRRIGFHGSDDKADLATLKLIHKLHVMSIPFEGLSVHCGEKITMDLEVIFNKLVRSNRGGWCMENNYLFGWVLRQMGYNTVTLGSKVYQSAISTFKPVDTHLINKVIIDGKAYIADVSYGMSYQVWEPMELVSGKDQPQPAGIFRFVEKGAMWVLEKVCRKPKILNPEFAKSNLVNKEGTNPIHCFTLEPREADHFIETCENLQTEPNTLFTNKSICSLQTPTGFRALIGWTYSEVTFKPEEGVDVLDMRNIPDEEIDQILREKFNIKLRNKLQPVNKSAYYTM